MSGKHDTYERKQEIIDSSQFISVYSSSGSFKKILKNYVIIPIVIIVAY